MPEIKPEIGAYRQFLADMKPATEARVGGPVTGVAEADYNVPARDGSSTVIWSYMPHQAPPKGSPLIVMYQGGGFA
jgi:hypothetical protein